MVAEEVSPVADFFFYTIEASQMLLRDRKTTVRTQNLNKRFIPKDFVGKKNRPVDSLLFGFHQDKMNLVF